MKTLITAIVILVFLFPLESFAGKNPADFPLEIHVLQMRRNRDRYGVVHSSGRGNVKDASSIHAFDFSYDGCPELRTTAANLSYPGKWKKDQFHLNVLIAEVGTTDKFRECELKTTVRNEVYFRGMRGGVIALSQEQFKTRMANRASRQDQAAPASDTVKLSVTSNPDGADVEIDGDFMGSTPSVLELSPGEHEVVVRKNGFGAWERKLKLVGGDVKVSAELEKAKH